MLLQDLERIIFYKRKTNCFFFIPNKFHLSNSKLLLYHTLIIQRWNSEGNAIIGNLVIYLSTTSSFLSLPSHLSFLPLTLFLSSFLLCVFVDITVQKSKYNFVGIVSLCPLCVSRDWMQVIRLSLKHFYLKFFKSTKYVKCT